MNYFLKYNIVYDPKTIYNSLINKLELLNYYTENEDNKILSFLILELFPGAIIFEVKEYNKELLEEKFTKHLGAIGHIEGLLNIYDYILFEKNNSIIKEGDKIKVLIPPFKDYTGIVQLIKDDNVSILLEDPSFTINIDLNINDIILAK